MKVIILCGAPMSTGIPVEELKQHWSMLNAISGVDCIIKTYANHSTMIDLMSLIDSDADAVIGIYLKRELFTESFFESHPKLKYIAGLAHGYENFDTELTKRYGVTITNTVYGANTIAEFSFALLLDICHNIGIHNNYVKSNDWTNDPNPRYMFGLSNQLELYEKTIGIIGLGHIGYSVAKIANGFGMKVLAYSRHKKTEAKYNFIEQVSLDELYAASDIISLHVPLNPHTHHLINKESISKMKDGVILINTSRGNLINENDLILALNSGKIYAAGLDVISEEPPRSNLPILSCENAVITDHIAYLPKTSRLRAITVAIDNFKAYLNGTPVSVINS